MRSTRGVLFGLIGSLGSLTLVLGGGRAEAQAPTILVAAGANQVAYTGIPNVLSDDPGVFWYTPPSCSGVGTASDGTSPARISRGTTYGAPARAILSVNPPRPATTCNPYRLLSNIAVAGASSTSSTTRGRAAISHSRSARATPTRATPRRCSSTWARPSPAPR